MPVDPATFRAVLGRFASGVTIVSARDGDRDVGMTVSAFCSISLEPPLVLASISEIAEMRELVERVDEIGVSILSQDQEAISRRFAEYEGDRFEGVGIVRGTTGVALIDGAIAHAECRIVQRHVAGDHLIVIAEVDNAATFDERPLLYYRGGYAGMER